ncbi:D-glycero-beta-D-manno-heptose 1-phosphate adenylyltransferase [Caulobacter sp. CCUG 60055]|uniref:D-glycero-beta-D-manno-heptose 1-phosphate adenylyltransferase n=1 Tax=Caulobacter sp. CCUG 60055 TaxID=2100090 RepID=UPI001FA7793C|nr:D-glycero-beta-D-manno-heptose 1-phosphate adenylyltransferase [Caulobacter sp. CCUG 60055]MCI3178938.1 D-glycero-beta-D-manno-heptose 1-phosphate adenylyltransferase [Caulobacter sp. CCUG 60055]
MDLSTLQSLLGAVAGVRVACIGDLMLDRYVYGEVARISPEAPIPVLARKRETTMLGGAGNVARNVAALGGCAPLTGLVGDDPAAREVLGLIGAERGVESHVVVEGARPTTVKIRFVAGGQQLLRVDSEDATAVQPDGAARLERSARGCGDGARAILLSDYGKGVVTPAVIKACLAMAAETGAALIVDSKARDFAKYGAADIIKPNAAELSRATDLPTDTDAEIEAALTRALTLCECKAILVTRAAKGMSLAARGEPVRHFAGAPREVFDVSGAGDTALAALGLALAAGRPIAEAVQFAILASGVAVEKAGTAVVTPPELVEAELSAHRAPADAKIATPERMVEEVAQWRAAGLRVGFTNGCFDILHRGHVAYLAQARGWCDRLIVGLNSDRSVRALKGDGRPVNDLESRALVLAGLSHVDLVVPFDEDTPLALIEAARPDVLVKGADYTVEGVVGHDIVQAYGGEVKLARLVDGYSTTAAIKRMSEKAR